MTHKVAECALIVFLRMPEWGKVKTRLANTLGNDAALSIYQDLMAMTLSTATHSNLPVYLFYDGGLPPLNERNNSFSYHLQIDGHLGTRIAHALSFVLASHAKVIIVGSDCPDLTPEIIHHGFDLLDDTDIIIGPARDGGYYLLGCKALIASLFEDIPWGTPSVFALTKEKIKQAGLQFQTLVELTDIDTEDDWNLFTKRTL